MNGQRQDEFIHCTNPGLEKERFCILSMRTGIVCCLPTCAQGSSAADMVRRGGGRGVGDGAFWAFWVLLRVLCIWRVLALLVFPLMSAGFGLRRCANRWIRPVGGGRWGHYLRDPRGVHWFAQKGASNDRGGGSNSIFQSCTWLALAGLPSLHDY